MRVDLAKVLSLLAREGLQARVECDDDGEVAQIVLVIPVGSAAGEILLKKLASGAD